MGEAEVIRDRVLGARAPSRIRARAAWQSRESLVRYELEVDHAGEVTPSDGYRSRVTMVPLTLVFPEKLPIWGRRGDTGIPVSSEPLDGHRELITVRWFADPAMRSTLVFDHRLGMVTRYADGLTVTILDAIEAD